MPSMAKWLALIGMSVWFAACGGGGGGGGGSSAVSFSLSSTSVAISAVENGPPPTTTVTATAQNGTVFFSAAVTTGSLGNLTASVQSCVPGGTSCQIAFVPAVGATAPAGTYTATVTVTGCVNQVCGAQVAGSPQTIAVTYTLAAGALLSADQSLVSAIVAPGASSPAQNVALSSSSGATAWTSSISNFDSNPSSDWLTVPASGTAPSSVPFVIAPLTATGSYVAEVTFTPTGGGQPVTVQVRVAVHANGIAYVVPYIATSNSPDTVILRGLGFAALTNPTVKFGSTAGSNVQVISDSEIHVSHPALSAGSYAVGVSDATPTILPSRATLIVQDRPAYAYAAIARDPQTQNPVNTADKLIYDAERQRVLLYNFQNNGALAEDEVWAYTFAAGSWSSPSQPLTRFNPRGNPTIAGNSRVMLTPDGIALIHVGAFFIDFLDPLSGASSQGSADIRSPFGFLANLSVAAMTNDGLMLGSVIPSNTSTGLYYRYDSLTNQILSAPSPANITTTVSRDLNSSPDGSVALATLAANDGGASVEPLVVYNSSTGRFSNSTFTPAQFNVLSFSRDGSKVLVLLTAAPRYSVISLPSTILGDLPAFDAGVVSPDGTRAYTYIAGTTTVHAYDLTAATVGGAFPEIGSGLVLADSPGVGPAMTITPDGGTLIVAGSINVIVTPHP
jgi:hypothetical protein